MTRDQRSGRPNDDAQAVGRGVTGSNNTGVPGKRTLIESLSAPYRAVPSQPVQRKTEGTDEAGGQSPPRPPTSILDVFARPTAPMTERDGAADQGAQATASSPSRASTDSGGAGLLPHRADMERSFGRSFEHVQAHTGMAAQLAPLGAEALTVGHTVAFADAQPTPALVAHEATHVVQNERAGAAAAMAAGVVAPRDSAAEAEADANARRVAAQGAGVRLPEVAAAPAAHVQLSPKLLVPDTSQPSPGTSIVIPDANHPARRDADGEQVTQTGEVVGAGQAAPLRGTSWKTITELTEEIDIGDDSGDTLHIDITYRLESRPAEVGDVPDIWVHTERKALLTVGTGEHAGATIVGQARIALAPGERNPKAAIGKPSLGAAHWAEVYLAEAGQNVSLFGPGGRASLLADAADNDVLAYDEPLRMLVGLKNLLKQHHVAGHGVDVARMHAKAQQLLAVARRGRALLERELASIASYHDPHAGQVAPVRWLVGDIENWLADNQRAGRDDTEDARQLRNAHSELQRSLADVDNAHPPKRHQLDDALATPVRFVGRTAEGIGEVGEMAVDAVVLGVDAIGQATGIGTFNYHPISSYGKSVDATGASTTAALVTMVNGFADQWSDAIERARNGDYRSLTDVSVDTAMLIDGARTGGLIALDKAEALAAKLGHVATSARAVLQSTVAGARLLPVEARNIAAAIADGADAFVARLHGGMHMSTAGGGGGPGPTLGGGMSPETLADAAQAAKKAFSDTRATQATATSAGTTPPPAVTTTPHETSYHFVEITDVNGSPIGEFDTVIHDGVATDRFIEDKSARGLKHPKNRQTPAEWAGKQILDKTNIRIKNIDGAVHARPRPDGLGSQSVPTVDQLRTIREFEFVIESADPAVQTAVDAQLAILRTQHPGFRFKARYGK